jgi:glutamate dehydrogenase/leucine dehydrogenase
MASVFTATRFVTCVPRGVGGSGNPSQSTARGVVSAMEAALDFLGKGSLLGKTVAMQGIGNVGSFMTEELLARGVARVIASDISESHIANAKERFGEERLTLRHVSKDDPSILTEACDILAPNALGGILDENTISTLATPIVCGAANNQLFDDRADDRRLAERGILFVPDFVANRMGIVNCANEQYGRLDDDPAITRHFSRDWENSVYQVTRRILKLAEEEGTTPTVAANRLADRLSLEPHPIWGHRAFSIIQNLRARGWQNQAS